ncbi:hypothetical protein ABKV19_023649 [Rosa sericea]
MATSSSTLRVGYRFDPTQLPVGYRFHPTEEELVGYFLKKKIQGHDFDDVIPEIDICSYEPLDLPAFSPLRSDDEEWFYFSRPDYKSGKKQGQANRATERGYWKITAKEGTIRARRSKAVIGKKRILTFYTGKVRSGQKTSWGIHEYYIPETLLPNAARQRDFVLCRLKKKDESTNIGACDEGEPSTNNASDFQNLMAEDWQITLQENTRPNFPSRESPQSQDYFFYMMGDNIVRVNAVSESAIGRDDSEDVELFVNSCLVDDGDYSVEETSRTTLLNHSSEPKSLVKVYDEGIHQQGMSSTVASTPSVRDKNDMLLKFLQKNASPVNVAANLPRNIGRVQSVNSEESKNEAIYVLQAGSFSDMQEVKYTSKLSEMPKPMAVPPRPKPIEPPTPKPKPVEPPRPKPMAPPSNDERKGMKEKQTGTTISDWKSSFIVWKESSLSLGSHPPVVYTWNMIGGLILFIFFVGELISYGKWY